jgi:hypothetical protein
MASSDSLHEPGIADALLVVYIAQFRSVDARRADGRRREGEALTHGFGGGGGKLELS